MRSPAPPIGVLCLAILAFAPGRAATQEIEPRAFSPSPTGVTFVLIGAGQSSGGILTDPSLPVDDVDATCDRVVASGVELDRGPEDSPPAGRVAVFRDPSGHRWFLNQPLD